jgi:glutamate/tyrosine decarboxylase-like PLP-dependent enzyme
VVTVTRRSALAAARASTRLRAATAIRRRLGTRTRPSSTAYPARSTVETLLRVGTATATASARPRFYHFVIGGSTPAALAADWVASMLDQNAFVRASSRFADAAETVTLDWLRELVGLPSGWGGALTASATFANLTGLALATRWWGSGTG